MVRAMWSRSSTAASASCCLVHVKGCIPVLVLPVCLELEGTLTVVTAANDACCFVYVKGGTATARCT